MTRRPKPRRYHRIPVARSTTGFSVTGDPSTDAHAEVTSPVITNAHMETAMKTQLATQALADRIRARIPQLPEDRDISDWIILEICNLADRGDAGAIATLREIERSGGQVR